MYSQCRMWVFLDKDLSVFCLQPSLLIVTVIPPSQTKMDGSAVDKSSAAQL